MTTTKKSSFDFWKICLGGARLVVAPMVDQSELAWRMLSRQYGAELCYTPMIHASMFYKSPAFRKTHFSTCPEDRPLIVQFCANDPTLLLEAAKLVEGHCDAVDINLGCPQGIAKRGHYGAFLQDDWDLITRMIKLLHHELSVPVTCKIRVFKDIEQTVKYAKMLESAGCQLLTVHGRTREQRGTSTGLANWAHIQAVKQSVSIPVFANGNIQFLEDVDICFKETMVDGVMSAEGNLYNPALFTGQQPACWTMVEDYLKWVKLYPPTVSIVKGHLIKLWLRVFQTPGYMQFMDRLCSAKTIEVMESLSSELKSLLLSNLSEEALQSDYSTTSLPFWRCQPYNRHDSDIKRPQESPLSDSEQCKKKLKLENGSCTKVKKQWVLCVKCKDHPKGLKCVNDLCRNCCKVKSVHSVLDCSSHRLFFKTKSERRQSLEQEEQLVT